jgi:transcription initiation factor TFIIIB Brf1 subunit/transcription initiation factor TFIIB
MCTGALVLSFPLNRRRALVARLAAQMLARVPGEAEKHLTFELLRHKRILSRRQLSEEVIERQLRALEGAVRAKIWHVVMAPIRPSGDA